MPSAAIPSQLSIADYPPVTLEIKGKNRRFSTKQRESLIGSVFPSHRFYSVL